MIDCEDLRGPLKRKDKKAGNERLTHRARETFFSSFSFHFFIVLHHLHQVTTETLQYIRITTTTTE